jgi:hypothetical protein
MIKLFEYVIEEKVKTENKSNSEKMKEVYERLKNVRTLIKAGQYGLAKSHLDIAERELLKLKREKYDTKAVDLYLSWVDEFKNKIAYDTLSNKRK